jgi:ADP-ribosyl-[dinitrogen reductase] hydrolase
MTHFETLAEETSVIYNTIAFHVFHGKGPKEAIKDEIKETIYEPVLNGKKPSSHPDGFVVNTMNWVLY